MKLITLLSFFAFTALFLIGCLQSSPASPGADAQAQQIVNQSNHSANTSVFPEVMKQVNAIPSEPGASVEQSSGQVDDLERDDMAEAIEEVIQVG